MFLSRSAWGAMPANRESGPRPDTQMIFVHHSAVTKPTSIDQAKAQWAAIQADHLERTISETNPTLWRDVAYNIGVGPGVILEGRGWDVVGGGTGPGTRFPHYSGSWDNYSVSICVLGNYQDDILDDSTRASLVAAFAEARLRYSDKLDVFGDRTVNYTKCPGDALYSVLNELWVQSALLEDDMPSAKEVSEAMMDELIEVHDYETGANSQVPLRTVEGWKLSELSQIRIALTKLAAK